MACRHSSRNVHFSLECVCVFHFMCTQVGSSPCRRIPLLGIAHLIVGKYFQVLEVNQEMEFILYLSSVECHIWLCYVIRKIMDNLSIFVHVNEKFCNKNLF